jgi:hypothetical protein
MTNVIYHLHLLVTSVSLWAIVFITTNLTVLLPVSLVQIIDIMDIFTECYNVTYLITLGRQLEYSKITVQIKLLMTAPYSATDVAIKQKNWVVCYTLSP